jgi:exodeoxyribonuclease V gamma subunit
MAIHLHRTNRMEALVDALAELVRHAPADPTACERIVVQGRGMERWLSMQLAERLGVWANPDFPFPRRMIEDVLGATVATADASAAPFQPGTLVWAIAALLPGLLDRPAFTALHHYLAPDAGNVRLIELAERIAATFDQYLVYRPAMVLAWERGAGTDWQAALWRALVERHGAHHVAARAAVFFDAVGRGAPALAEPPARLMLFGVSTLPPLYVEVLAVLARVSEIHVFVLSASAEFWGEIRSQREILRALRDRDDDTVEAAARLHLAEGHPLLAALGRLGRDFQQIVEGSADYVEDGADRYVDPGTATMLATLQSDVLHLRHRHPGSRDAPPLPLAADDRTISIHACHGPMREVEVLRDQLLALFDDDFSLQPHEVIVMSPAIDDYAPFIEAVFGSRQASTPTIPFRIADRAVRASNRTYDAFVRLLDTLAGRFTATEVTDLLEIDAMSTRAGLAPEELELIRRWTLASGIRWGIDAAHRESLDYPPIAENTWRFGLDRLLLGYAMPGHDATLYHDVLPYDDVEGAEAEALGRLAEFCARLFRLHDTLAAPRTLAAWRDDLTGALDDMIDAPADAGDEHLRVRVALGAIAERAAAVGFDAPVALESMRAALDRELAEAAAPHGFLGGGVTFSALVPMRSIPFRVVCLLGMSDDAFPHTARPASFDLMARAPRCGDRTVRDDDRYVFLEALLSARDRLLVTYVGQSIRDNATLPPSVVVSELLDALDETFADAAGRPARDHVVVRHPLQPFSPRYFRSGEDAELFSYAAEACAGARSLLETPQPPAPLIPRPLPPAPPPAAVDLDTLARFFAEPGRMLLRDRLGLRLGDELPSLDDREPLDVAGLDEWVIGDRLVARALAGDDLRDAYRAVRASGALPPGGLGALRLEEILPQVEAIARAASARRPGASLAPLEVDVRVAGLRVTGALRDLWEPGRVRAGYSKVGRKSEVRLWIEHLALGLSAPPGYPPTTWLVGRAATGHLATTCRFREVADPDAVLARLLRLYALGMDFPLPFFPQASRAYAARVLQDGPNAAASALAEARQAFAGTTRGTLCDLSDPYLAELYRGRDPFADACRPVTYADGSTLRFTELAVEIFRPLLTHREVLP